MCQQAIEKLSKGLYVFYIGQEASRTHNINFILRPLFELEGSLAQESSTYWDAYSSLFAELLAYYISERYPSYREKLSISVTEEMAKDVMKRTKEAFAWLRSLKK